jgi:hypothetical protein
MFLTRDVAVVNLFADVYFRVRLNLKLQNLVKNSNIFERSYICDVCDVFDW